MRLEIGFKPSYFVSEEIQVEDRLIEPRDGLRTKFESESRPGVLEPPQGSMSNICEAYAQ
jgi:hypothetical protein